MCSYGFTYVFVTVFVTNGKIFLEATRKPHDFFVLPYQGGYESACNGFQTLSAVCTAFFLGQ